MRHLLVLCALFFGVSYSTTSENNGTFGERVDGSGLIKLGRKLHKARLTIIGMAIHNQQKTIQIQQTAIENLQQIIENQQNTSQLQQQTIQAQQAAIENIQNLHVHSCGEWTPWSPCEASRRGYFGSQTRTRPCTYPDDSDVKNLTTEIDNKLCEGFCPISYTLTNNGFCISLNTTEVTHDEAVEHCGQDGAHLIHIDSQRKLDDVKTVLGGYDMHIHIDSRREDVTSPWEYTYGSKIAFLKWFPGDPTTGADQLYLVLLPKKEVQSNYKCSHQATILCEMVPQ